MSHRQDGFVCSKGADTNDTECGLLNNEPTAG